MAIDMKSIIAEAARVLLFEKKVKKLTVKDIVKECNITRQTFYYHFEDIPDLLRWILEKDTRKTIEECREQEEGEERLHYLITVALSMRPYIERSMQTNYGEEVEWLIKDFVYKFFEQAMEKREMYRHLNPTERKWILKYHCCALIGILHEWTKADSDNMDEIVHIIYLILQGEVRPFE